MACHLVIPHPCLPTLQIITHRQPTLILKAKCPQGVQWPTYGLPPAPPPPFPTFMPYPFLPTTNTPSSTFQPPNFNLDSQGKPIIPQPVPLLVSTTQPKDTVANDPHSKEKLQILEDRLRAIEGAGNFAKLGQLRRKGIVGKERCVLSIQMLSISIEKCEKFKEVLQSLIDSQLVQISCIRDEGGVNVVQESENTQTQAFPKVPTPLTLHGTHNMQASTCCRPRPITIQVPSPFPYKTSKAVPWKYDVQVGVGSVQGNQVNPSIGPGAPAVTQHLRRWRNNSEWAYLYPKGTPEG
ncbi:hypothetical protein SESBI_16315 [Sesbania bispinosa]|nr:hypothetical protein SESBI_16315 [Sesbania bispinosa]